MGFRIFVVVGMPGSGKNIARMFAEAKSIPYLATGDFVREEVRRRGLNPTAENTARVSTELRGADGLGVTRLALEAIKKGRGIAFLEGMRSWPEIELIRREAEAIVVAFLVPPGGSVAEDFVPGPIGRLPPSFCGTGPAGDPIWNVLAHCFSG